MDTVAANPAPASTPAAEVATAIARWREARDDAARAWGMVAADGDRDGTWGAIAGLREYAARHALVAAIHAAHGDLDDLQVDRCLRTVRPARGVRHGGRIYLAVVDPELDPMEAARETCHDVVHLVELDARHVADLDPAPTAGPDLIRCHRWA